MYMAMIGMAIVAVPRGVFRLLTWLVMSVVGWLLSGVESAYATVSSSVTGTAVTILSNGDSDTISVYADGSSVKYTDGSTTGTVMSGGSAIHPSVVSSLYVQGNGGHDCIDASAVTEDNGFLSLNLKKCTLFGGDGNDTILGRDFDLGDDCISGNIGNDYLDGGDGYDSIYGEDGADTIDGGAVGINDFDCLYHYSGPAGTSSDGDQDHIFANDVGNEDIVYRNLNPDNDLLN